MTDDQQTRIEAAVFRRLRDHLQANTEVQNIDLMLLADFCRNCLGKNTAAAEAEGVDLDPMDARDIVYGMPYAEGGQAPASGGPGEAGGARGQVGSGIEAGAGSSGMPA